MNDLTQEIDTYFEAILNKYFEIKLISLCSVDGFSVSCKYKGIEDIESDTIAAISSSLFSLAKASSKQILQGELSGTLVETNTGNLIFKHVVIKKEHYVISMMSSKKMLLGEANFVLADCVKNISKF